MLFVLFLSKYVEGSPILLGMLQLFQLLEIQFPTKCWFVHLDVTAGRQSSLPVRSIFYTEIHRPCTWAWEMCSTDLPLFSWPPKDWDKIAKIKGCCTMTIYDGAEWPLLAEGTALSSLLESDHGVVGLGIWNNSTLEVIKKDRPFF